MRTEDLGGVPSSALPMSEVADFYSSETGRKVRVLKEANRKCSRLNALDPSWLGVVSVIRLQI